MIRYSSVSFTIQADQVSVFTSEDSGLTLKCASVCKPLFVWSASKINPYFNDSITWKAVAKEAVAVSSNQAMQIIWDACAGDAIISQLQTQSGINFKLDNQLLTWGSLPITASKLASAYGAMIGCQTIDTDARVILQWMTMVPGTQTFGLRSLAAEVFNVKPNNIGIKCGWYIDKETLLLRTHACVYIKLSETYTVGISILTAAAVSAHTLAEYLSAYKYGDEVLHIHEQYAGRTLREEAKRLFTNLAIPII